jgi:tetratricopeptide (TPR) repeat protein
MQLDYAERAYLRQFLLTRFGLEDLKDLAFDLGVNYELFHYGTSQAFVRELILYFERRNWLGSLVSEVVRLRPDNDLCQLLEKLPEDSPRTKIQVITSEDRLQDVSELLNEIAGRLDIAETEIELVAVARGSMRLLVGLPEEASSLQAISEIDSLAEGEYGVDSIVLFDSLDPTRQEAWRLVALHYPPVHERSALHPQVSWRRALQMVREALSADSMESTRHPKGPIRSIALKIAEFFNRVAFGGRGATLEAGSRRRIASIRSQLSSLKRQRAALQAQITALEREAERVQNESYVEPEYDPRYDVQHREQHGSLCPRGHGVLPPGARFCHICGAQAIRVSPVTADRPTAIPAGIKAEIESINSFSTILATFQKVMDLTVSEAEGVKASVQEMADRLVRLEEAHHQQQEMQHQQVEELLQSAVRLRRGRHEYTSPDPDLIRQMTEFRTQMDSMQREILDRYSYVASPADHRAYGEIYLRRGVIAYLDSDMQRSREMLQIAERFYPPSRQDVGSMVRDERLSTAFIQFYLALIEKNYGTMAAAREHIEASYRLYGQDEPAELLTPVTRAEILSCLNDMDRARVAIQDVLDRAENLQQTGSLLRHSAIYALRARMLLGNTYYVSGQWQEALDHYQETLLADVDRHYSYYVHHSIAQVYHKLGDEEKAQEHRCQAYDELVKTDHLRTKVALDTQILLNALAYLCTRQEEPQTAEKHRAEIQELWFRIRPVGGLELRLFSFDKARPVSKEEFWAEVFAG